MSEPVNSRSTDAAGVPVGRVLVACEDLFFRVNLEARIREARLAPAAAADRPALEAALESPEPRLVAAVVDLHLPGDAALEWIRRLAAARPGIPILAFGSHVERETLEAARRAGADALPRSRFARELPGFLERAAIRA